MDGGIWLDALYFRLTTPRFEEFKTFVRFTPLFMYGDLFMTEVTMQGNGDGLLDCH